MFLQMFYVKYLTHYRGNICIPPEVFLIDLFKQKKSRVVKVLHLQEGFYSQDSLRLVVLVMVLKN